MPGSSLAEFERSLSRIRLDSDHGGVRFAIILNTYRGVAIFPKRGLAIPVEGNPEALAFVKAAKVRQGGPLAPAVDLAVARLREQARKGLPLEFGNVSVAYHCFVMTEGRLTDADRVVAALAKEKQAPPSIRPAVALFGRSVADEAEKLKGLCERAEITFRHVHPDVE